MEIYIEDLKKDELKVLSYWNLNKNMFDLIAFSGYSLKYYHIGI